MERGASSAAAGSCYRDQAITGCEYSWDTGAVECDVEREQLATHNAALISGAALVFMSFDSRCV